MIKENVNALHKPPICEANLYVVNIHSIFR